MNTETNVILFAASGRISITIFDIFIRVKIGTFNFLIQVWCFLQREVQNIWFHTFQQRPKDQNHKTRGTNLFDTLPYIPVLIYPLLHYFLPKGRSFILAILRF